jgi:small multidrug resistance family-3 protein
MSMVAQVVMMLFAAVFEVAGDALVRRGISGGGIALIAIGFVVLGTYGIVVNLIGLDFSRLLGAYVGWFAVVSMLFGRLFFGDRVTITTYVGLVLVLTGSLVIQTGPKSGITGISKAQANTVR